ncbi:hypothetical protein ABPG74_016557 [Tetrahymena malaccensis]
MKTFTGTQRQSQNLDKLTMMQFKATTDLHSQLVKERKKIDSTRVFVNTGKELLKQARIEKMNEKLNPIKDMTIESEVIALSNFSKPFTHPRTQEMIQKQRESRRDRHIKTLNDFEKWTESLSNDVVDSYTEIKHDIEDYFIQHDKELNAYFDKFSDQELLKREKDLLDEINQIVVECGIKKENKVDNLDNRLEDLEKEREKNLKFFCDKLEFTLIDIAFELEPQVKVLVDIKRREFEQIVAQKRIENDDYIAKIKQQQKESFEAFVQRQNQVDKRWRKLKHDAAFEEFMVDIKQMEYVNPDKRIQLYEELKRQHVTIYTKRNNFIQKLDKLDIINISKAYVEKWIEDTKNFHEQAQEILDARFEALIKESEEAKQHSLDRINKLHDRLEYVGHLNAQDLNSLIELECVSISNKYYEDSRDLLTKAIKFVEESDFKQNELVSNIGKFFKNIGEKNDENKKNYNKMNFEYELKKANIADENDEKLIQLNDEFEKIKVEMKMALHHPKLNEVLDVCFKKIDEIENEYRDFHDKNQSLAKEHSTFILNLYAGFEKAVAQFFELLDVSKKQELEQRNLKRATEKAQKLIEREDKMKEIEEYKAAQEAAAAKKGGAPPKKPPPKKAGDPKKAAAEAEQRLKTAIDQIGIEQVEQFTSPVTQNQYVVAFSIEEIAKRFYEIQEEEKKEEVAEAPQQQEQKQPEPVPVAATGNKKDDKKAAQPAPAAKNAKQPEQVSAFEIPVLEEEKPIIPVDFKVDPPVDPEGRVILEKNVVVELSFMVNLIDNCKRKLFDYISKLQNDVIDQAKSNDKDFIENSILILDERLKAHYPLKGKMEVEIYQIRSAQITVHKKRYERHARTTIEKVDLQTEHFNFLMEQAFEDLQEHETEQKNYKDSLSSATTLAKLQGIQNHVKENAFKFGEKIRDLEEKLTVLGNAEVEFLLQKNRAFIKESKLFEDGGEYSKDEVQWYEGMMKEIDDQLNSQKQKRNVSIAEILKHLNQKKTELLEAFEKQYVIAIEELAAKDGTGKKYGRPRRYVQERMRTEMTKCEKAQDAVNELLAQLRSMYAEYQDNIKNEQYHLDEAKKQNSKDLFAMRVRQTLMTLRTCIGRYAIHIDALKPDSQVQEMPRVTYIEKKFDCVLDPTEQEQDLIWKEAELEFIGPLFFQKEPHKFMDWVTEIEKNTILEAQKIYVGDKSKFLTGADKCPDYLRNYIQNNRKNAEEFRISSCRNLRNSCEELSQLSTNISEMIIQSMNARYNFNINLKDESLMKEFAQLQNVHQDKKQQHLQQLRPNLSNPQCKPELIDLVKREKERITNYFQSCKQFKENVLDLRFIESNEFFKSLLNHFEFLLTYYDSEVLFEDFKKLPGDDDIQKKHENIKVLLRMKQKGTVIDTSSERSLSKTWDGILLTTFCFDDRKIEYKLTTVQEDDKGKGGAKKDAKKAPPAKAPPAPAKGGKTNDKQQEVQEENPNLTKAIKSFKTYRQKSANSWKKQILEEFKKQFETRVQQIKSFFEKQEMDEYKFEFKWEQNISSLNNL